MGQVDISHDRAADEDVLDRALVVASLVPSIYLRKSFSRKEKSNQTRETTATYQVRVLELLEDLDIIKLDVEVLVDALQGPPDLDVILELDGDLVVDEGLEKTEGRGA